MVSSPCLIERRKGQSEPGNEKATTSILRQPKRSWETVRNVNVSTNQWINANFISVSL